MAKEIGKDCGTTKPPRTPNTRTLIEGYVVKTDCAIVISDGRHVNKEMMVINHNIINTMFEHFNHKKIRITIEELE